MPGGIAGSKIRTAMKLVMLMALVLMTTQRSYAEPGLRLSERACP